MYLFEMKDLPKTADKAILEWDKRIARPRREREKISLPYDPLTMYFPLQGGNQFLLSYNDDSNRRTWFGGTDEEPFLVEMESDVRSAYIQSHGSEKALYEHLVPENILRISQENNVLYKRQGDIFAVRFCGEQYFEKNLAYIAKMRIVEAKEKSVLATRHLGTGIGVLLTEGENVLFKGKIEAPDHKPLDLSDAFYLLGQTRHIVHPTQAD